MIRLGENKYTSHIPNGFDMWFDNIEWWLPLIYIPFSLFPDLSIQPITAAQHLMLALDYIHSKQIMHLDIKPENTKVTKDRRLVLIDFGSARSGDTHTGSDGGTCQYMSQRRSDGEKYSFEEDFVGAGVTLLQVFLRNNEKFPWRIPSDENPNGLRLKFPKSNMTKESFLNLCESVSDDIAKILYDMIFMKPMNYRAFDDKQLRPVMV